MLNHLIAGDLLDETMMPVCGDIASQLVQYRNCWLLRNHKLVRDDLWVRAGKILNPSLVFFEEKKLADVQIDCHGAIIAAGFIDIQCNGR